MKKNMGAKIFAGIALFGIIIGIIGTGLLFVLGGTGSTTETRTLSEEELQELINNANIDLGTGSADSSGEGFSVNIDNNEVIDVTSGEMVNNDILIEGINVDSEEQVELEIEDISTETIE